MGGISLRMFCLGAVLMVGGIAVAAFTHVPMVNPDGIINLGAAACIGAAVVGGAMVGTGLAGLVVCLVTWDWN